MRNSLIIALVFLLSMTCHAQKVSIAELSGTKWKLTKPVLDYCDKTMSFTNTTVTNTSNSHYINEKRRKKVNVFSVTLILIILQQQFRQNSIKVL